MQIQFILIYISIILWIFPIFKQYKTEYFLFFLILAAADPLIILVYQFIHFNAQSFSWVIILFLITSLTTKKRIRQTLLVVSLITMTISLFLFNMDTTIMMIISCMLHLVVLGIIIVNLLNRFLTTQSLNLFLCLLIVYESINIMKCMIYLSNNNSGTFSWYLGVITQYLFALLFTFININTKDFAFIPKQRF